ncbi:MAG: L,D-transpeptidase family protein [Pseudomonadales bacterium]|nr:L,D-transpeptidase family protein [Pseudomonadales bacterium]NIX09419.1 L,D-transpeptidase family protein [Pseudomonadales bacterium]
MPVSTTWTSAAALLASLLIAATAEAASYRLPEDGEDVIGASISLTLAYEDTLAVVAERYGVGYQELVDANPEVDPWLPGDGTRIVMPTAYVLPAAPREGIVINVAEYRLYYYPPGRGSVVTFPVGVGRMDFPTPTISTKVVTKIENPSWTPTEAARREHAEMGDPLPHVVPPGPDNPLGHLAIQLSARGYFIHGTNKPFGVGQGVSHGCVRLYPGDIETLTELVPNGTPVYIVNEPFKVGWRHDELWVEAHRNLYGENQASELVQLIVQATEKRGANVDWRRVNDVGAALTGVPVRL